MIISNDFEGLYAVPLDHPVTCLNPAPWKIHEMRLEKDWDIMGIKVWIRGEHSMWFRVDQCFCNDLTECEDYVSIKQLN